MKPCSEAVPPQPARTTLGSVSGSLGNNFGAGGITNVLILSIDLSQAVKPDSFLKPAHAAFAYARWVPNRDSIIRKFAVRVMIAPREEINRHSKSQKSSQASITKKGARSLLPSPLY